MTRPICRITVKDEVNCLLTNMSMDLKSRLKKHLTFFVPGARHTPKFKLGIWDGRISLFNEGWTFLNLIDEDLLSIIEDSGFAVEINDERTSQPVQCNHITAEEFSHLEGAPILRDYQVTAVNMALDSRSGIFRMATGAGKSYVCAAIAKRMSEHGRVAVIVPSINLVIQTADSFRALGIKDVGEFSGIEKRVADVTITTWQSLANYPEILEGVVCVIADECHQVKAQILNELLSTAAKNVPHRYGFTGTLPTDDLSRAKVKSVLGDIIFDKPAWELQQSGILAGCTVNVIQTQEKGRKFPDYQSESSFLVSDIKRLEWIANLIRTISESGNTMVLVRNVETGKKIAKFIGDKAVFISGSTKAKERKKEYDSLGKLDGKTLVCTKGIASTGIDVPRIFNLVLIEAGRSFTEVIQSIGRGLRKAEDKDHVEIYDVCADTKHSKRHLTERKKYYTEAKYSFVITRAEY